MGADSTIEWCDHTFNPWIGCTKVSPGCANCYAEGESKRRGWAQWGKGKERHRTSAFYWKQPLKWNRDQFVYGPEQKAGILLPRRPRVFCASLADWLDDEVPIEWLADFLQLVRICQNLDFLLLTKRPENWDARIHEALAHVEGIPGDWPSRGPDTHLGEWINDWTGGEPPKNVWIGVSVEDQQRAHERIPLLLQIPAMIRFLSCEPLLGPIDFSKCYAPQGAFILPHGIDWAICGGESGPHARPMHPNWARHLRDDCVAAGIPFFFKQWGEWFPVGEDGVGKFKPISERDARSRFHIWPDKEVCLRVGKKHAGRLLYGCEWNEFPTRKAGRSYNQENRKTGSESDSFPGSEGSCVPRS
jgi:protein gp37